MDIKDYIRNKSLVKVLSLDDDKKILRNLNLDSYDQIESINEYKKNIFSDDELLVIITNYNKLNEEGIFESISGINNIMLLVIKDTEFLEDNLKVN